MNTSWLMARLRSILSRGFIALFTLTSSLMHLHGFSLFSSARSSSSAGNVLERAEIAAIAVGMSREQVQKILGGSVLKLPVKTETLYYVECFDAPIWDVEHYFSLRQVKVYFDEQKHVTKLIWQDFYYGNLTFDYSIGNEMETEEPDSEKLKNASRSLLESDQHAQVAKGEEEMELAEAEADDTAGVETATEAEADDEVEVEAEIEAAAEADDEVGVEAETEAEAETDDEVGVEAETEAEREVEALPATETMESAKEKISPASESLNAIEESIDSKELSSNEQKEEEVDASTKAEQDETA